MVIIMSHHRLSDFHRRSEVSPAEVEALFTSHANVVLHLTGHGHKNTKTLHHGNKENDSGGSESGISAFEQGGYWKLMTASTMDFPMQSRIIEIVDESNGFISIYVTNLDHNSTEDSLAHHARDIAAGKNAFMLAPLIALEPGFRWDSDVSAQNILIQTRLPDSVRENLDHYDWSKIIESESTLSTL
jgi:tRNA(Phe) wybutosine-synthesizing methylase Tyw3